MSLSDTDTTTSLRSSGRGHLPPDEVHTVLEEITDVFTAVMRAAIPPVAADADATAQMTVCHTPALGHYQCNRCALSTARQPRQSALCLATPSLTGSPPKSTLTRSFLPP